MAREKRKIAQRVAGTASQPFPRGLICGLLAVYLALTGGYCALIPVGLAPDESAHLKYVQWLAEHRSFPVLHVGQEPAAARENAGYEAHQPPLYYLLAAPGYLAFRAWPDLAPHLPLLLNLLISLVVIGATYGFVRQFLPAQPRTAVAAAGILAFVPMHLALSASITNDILAEAFFALTLWLLARHLRRAEKGEPDRGPAWVGVCCGLGILTKSLCLLLLPVAWAGLLLASQRDKGLDARAAARKIAIVTLLAALLGGPWLMRNQVRYGDPLAGRAFMAAFTDRPTPRTMMENPSAPLSPLAYSLLVASWTYASFWGGGWHRLPPRSDYIFFPNWIYVLLGVIALASLGGFCRWLVRRRREAWQRQGLLVSALLTALVLAAFVRFNLQFFQAQGRYLFPALPVGAFIFATGFRSLFSTERDSPLALLPALGLALLSALALPLWILPDL